MSEEFKERIVISNNDNTDKNDTYTHEDAIKYVEYMDAVHKVFYEYSPNLLAIIREKIRELYNNNNKTKSEKEKTDLLILMNALEREMFEKINVKYQSKDDSEVEWRKVVRRINKRGRTGDNYIWLLKKYSIEELEAMRKEIEPLLLHNPYSQYDFASYEIYNAIMFGRGMAQMPADSTQEDVTK